MSTGGPAGQPQAPKVTTFLKSPCSYVPRMCKGGQRGAELFAKIDELVKKENDPSTVPPCPLLALCMPPASSPALCSYVWII